MPITYTGLLPAPGITALSGVSVHDAEADQVVGLGLWGQEQSVLEQMMEQKQRLDQQDKRLLKLECGSFVAAEGSSMSKLELTSDCGSGRLDAVLEDRVRVLEERLQQIASNVSQLSRGLLEEKHQQDLVIENMSREIKGIGNVDRSLSTAPDPTSVAQHDNLSKRLEELELEQAQLKEQQGKVDSYLESWSSKQAEHNQSECNSEEWQSFHRLHGSVWDAFLVQWFHTSRITVEEAQKQQSCLDVDYNEPARASLRELLGMQSCKMTSGDDLLGRCGEPAVRRYCPQTCYCNAVSWWYDLSSCPVKCWPEYASNLTRHIQLQERGSACMEEPENEPLRLGHLPFLGGNLTFFSSFVSKELIEKGHLSESAHPSAAVQTRVKWISRNECRLKRNVPMSIEAIVSAGHCEGLMWVDTVFDTRLCEIKERYDSGLQNIAAFCPGSCQVCSLFADAKKRSIFDYTFRSIADRWMYSHVEAYIECGYEWIFSGESLNGTLSPDEHYIGKPAPEKVYSFWAPEGISYSFKATGSLALDLFIYDNLAESPLYQSIRKDSIFENFLSDSQPSRLNNISFTKEGRYHLVVESSFLPRDTSEFTISMATNDLHCSQQARQEIHCEDSLNASINNDMYFRNRLFPEKIFRFWADPGVQYTLDSCGSSIRTEVELHDEFFRDPTLMTNDRSMQTCSQKERGHLKWTSKVEGYYHVVIRSYWDTGYIKLAMHCEG